MEDQTNNITEGTADRLMQAFQNLANTARAFADQYSGLMENLYKGELLKAIQAETNALQDLVQHQSFFVRWHYNRKYRKAKLYRLRMERFYLSYLRDKKGASNV